MIIGSSLVESAGISQGVSNINGRPLTSTYLGKH